MPFQFHTRVGRRILSGVAIFYSFLCLISCSQSSKKESGFIHIGKLRIFYESQGSGSAVLLLHAGLQDHTMWEKQVDALKDRHQVITIDLPGHGQSSGNDTTVLIADALIHILDSLQIKKTSVVGLSYGAASATDLLLAYADRIDKVVLVSPGLTGWDKFLKADSISLHYFAALDSAFKKKDDASTTAIFMEAWYDGPFRKPEQINQEVRKYGEETTLKNLKTHREDSWGSFSKETGAARAGQIKNQVLIVYGDQDIPFILEVSHFLHSSIAGSKEVRLVNVAHMLNLEAANEFNGLLTTFLN